MQEPSSDLFYTDNPGKSQIQLVHQKQYKESLTVIIAMKRGIYIYLTSLVFLIGFSFDLIHSMVGYTVPISEAILESEAAEKSGESSKELPERDFLYLNSIVPFQTSSNDIKRASFNNPELIYLDFNPLVLNPPPDITT
jgi:hypothetical protein